MTAPPADDGATGVVIEPLPSEPSPADVEALAGLLSDAVAAGEAVSFLAPLDRDRAAAWWRDHVAAVGERGAVLVARRDGAVVGTVTVLPAWAPNQPHRAEICKLLVHADHRRAGLGTRLMAEAEDAARTAGFELLTLDATRDGAADRLYRRTGWTAVGVIPDFALWPDGRTPHDAVVFFKRL